MRSTILPNPSQLVIGAGIRRVAGSTPTGDTTHPLSSSTPLPCIVPDHTRPCPISIFERVIPWSELAVLPSSVPRSIIKLSDEGWLGVDERSTKGASGTGLPMVISTRLPSSTQRKVRKSVMDVEGDDDDGSIAWPRPTCLNLREYQRPLCHSPHPTPQSPSALLKIQTSRGNCPSSLNVRTGMLTSVIGTLGRGTRMTPTVVSRLPAVCFTAPLHVRCTHLG